MKGEITIVGLGSGDEQQLTLGVWNVLQQAQHLYLRTADHPVVSFLDQQQIAYQTFDDIYRESPSFSDVYETIAAELIQAAKTHDDGIVYAVPGHPMVAEATTQLLKTECAGQVKLSVIGGESFLDQAFTRLGFDPLAGFQLLDGNELDPLMLQPRIHTIIAQVYDRFIASDVKLSLMSYYPDDHPVIIGHSLGIQAEEQVLTVPLYELDRQNGYGNRSLIWIPPTEDERVLNKQFNRLQEIIHVLRSPEGCPWDREQTHQSIRKNLIEETYEVLEAIDDDDPEAMCEELGDLLMQIMLHAEMEAEEGTFTITDVIAGLNSKLIRRHPHVFADRKVLDAEEALKSWQEIKAEERRSKNESDDHRSLLEGIPRQLPEMMTALQLQKRAAKAGFDWPTIEEVLDKLLEEYKELQQVAVNSHQAERQMEELGDVLFSVINVARFLKLDPEAALAQTNRKFISRFKYIEEQLRLKGWDFEQTDLQQMETWWQEAKNTHSTNIRT